MLNSLAKEKSPYLLQHQHNPVSWYPWGEEAFSRAREEDKPIFLSIGYSTCYWCHVMEHESFEHSEVAELLNRVCISIKVDREERPDIDQIYMDAVVALHGHGGWPLSCFLTPQLKTFFGGTYFPREQFIALLKSIEQIWQTKRDDVLSSADSIMESLDSFAGKAKAEPLDEGVFEQALKQLSLTFDSTNGGFGPAPKFPQTSSLSLLLRIHRKSSESEALRMVEKTLDAMAAGGMHDHLGGGFHRYSTDEKWQVPHFEKMLYDNALLTKLYLEGFLLTKKKAYADTASQTLDYLLREMLSAEGGFYSAQDAGEVGREGEHYVWSYEEIAAFLKPDELSLFVELFQVSPGGNFESSLNILYLRDPAQLEESYSKEVMALRQKLLHFRAERRTPHLDDKLITSWNGLVIGAMARGARVLQNSAYLRAAQRAAAFLRSKMWREGVLYRRYRDNDTRFLGCLDDYAFLISGLLDLYQSDFDARWVFFAEELQQQLDLRFWDDRAQGYFFTDGSDTSLLLRKKQFHDGALPAGNAVAAENLLKLSVLLLKPDYRARAEEIFAAASPLLLRFPSAMSTLLAAYDYYSGDALEIISLGGPGEEEGKLLELLNQMFLPNALLIAEARGGGKESELPVFLDKNRHHERQSFYICQNGNCELPVSSAKEAIQSISV